MLHDAPVDDVDEVWIELSSVSAEHAELGWQVVSDDPGAVDLLTLQGGASEEIGLGDVPVGRYTQVRLELVSAWVVVDGVSHDLDIPSGFESGVKVLTDFEVTSCGRVEVVLDWDLGAHLVLTHQGYALRPTLAVDSIVSDGEATTVYGAPEAMSINTPEHDDGPDLATDGLTLFFSSRRPGGAGYWDLFTATRTARDQPFGDVQPIVELNGPGFDAHPSISSDMRTLYYDRGAVWVATRDGVDAPWGGAHPLPGYDGHQGPSIDAAQTRIVTQYWSGGAWDIYEGIAATPGDFAAPSPVAALNSPYHDAHPDLSEDGLTIYFESDRPPGSDWDLYVATRPSIDAPFGPPQKIESLAIGPRQGMPGIAPDGTELFYSDGYDLYRVEISRACE